MGVTPQLGTNVQVGEFSVFDCGVVTSPGNRPITIQLAEDIEVEFRFIYEGDGDPSYSAETINDTLVIKLENFKAGVVMGGTTPPIGLLEPITIGQLFDRELLLLFQVSSAQADNRTVHSTLYYNFYLGESIEGEGNVGE